MKASDFCGKDRYFIINKLVAMIIVTDFSLDAFCKNTPEKPKVSLKVFF